MTVLCKHDTKEVEQELMARFDDRNKAFMTKADVARIIGTQLIIEYQLDKASKSSRSAKPVQSQSGGGRTAISLADGPSLTNATTRITNRGVCIIPDFSPSVSLSSFTVISAVCRWENKIEVIYFSGCFSCPDGMYDQYKVR